MTDINLDFFKKRPSEELMDKVKEVVTDINPDLLKDIEDVLDQEED